MGETCPFPIQPTRGTSTFQSSGTATRFVHREAHDAIQAGDYDAYHKITGSLSREDDRAGVLVREKLGGAPGGATFRRDEIMVPARVAEVMPSAAPGMSVAPAKEKP